MYFRHWAVAAVVSLAAFSFSDTVDAAAPPKVGDFALLDTTGNFHQLSRYADQKAVVLFVHGVGCPVVTGALPELISLRDQYAKKDVQFLLLNAITFDELADIRKEAADLKLDMPILKDQSQLVAESLGAAYTSEVFVIHPKTRLLIYRGPIDNRDAGKSPAKAGDKHYLADVLASLQTDNEEQIAQLAREPIAVNGCEIDFPARKHDAARTISYTKEVAPIVQSRCVECHITGGVGPFAMNSHAALQGWAPMMMETILTRRMPPGQVDEQVGKWRDVHQMPAEEQATLAHWVAAGAPRDGDADPLEKAIARDPQNWSLGKPDLVIDMPEQKVPATGTIRIRTVTIPLEITQEQWVRAVEFKVGEKQVIHHIIATVAPAGARMARGARGEADEEGAEDAAGTSGFSYAPGMPLTVYPSDVGFRIMPQAQVSLSLHYFTNGKEVVDKSQIGLYFHQEKPKHEVRRISGGSGGLTLNGADRKQSTAGQATIAADSYLYNLRPYMTYYGNSIRYTAHFPDGRVQSLLNVPNYNFFWQMNYTPTEPIFLPAGTKITVDGVFGREFASGLRLARENFTGYVQIYEAK